MVETNIFCDTKVRHLNNYLIKSNLSASNQIWGMLMSGCPTARRWTPNNETSIQAIGAREGSPGRFRPRSACALPAKPASDEVYLLATELCLVLFPGPGKETWVETSGKYGGLPGPGWFPLHKTNVPTYTIDIYIYMLTPPPPRYQGLGLVQMCFDRGIVLHKWWLYMIFTVFCCTFMNHCNPDSSTKTHVSSHTKHVFFNNLSLQTILSSSHQKHVFLHAFFHKESHILSPNTCPFSMALPHKIQFTYLPTQTPAFKDPSTECSHIISHKACLFNNSSLQKIIHPLTKNMSCCMPYFTRNHISSHQTHALFQWLFHTKFNSHIFPHKPCLLSKTLPQTIHTSSHPTHVFLHVFFQ